jgi:ribosomal protein S6
MNTQKIYEIGMLINPDLSQQEAGQVVEKVKEILTKKSASVISEGEIVKIDLAYQIITKIVSKNERFNEANFV